MKNTDKNEPSDSEVGYGLFILFFCCLLAFTIWNVGEYLGLGRDWIGIGVGVFTAVVKFVLEL